MLDQAPRSVPAASSTHMPPRPAANTLRRLAVIGLAAPCLPRRGVLRNGPAPAQCKDRDGPAVHASPTGAARVQRGRCVDRRPAPASARPRCPARDGALGRRRAAAPDGQTRRRQCAGAACARSRQPRAGLRRVPQALCRPLRQRACRGVGVRLRRHDGRHRRPARQDGRPVPARRPAHAGPVVGTAAAGGARSLRRQRRAVPPKGPIRDAGVGTP